MIARVAAALVSSLIWITPVLADRHCAVPLADWQPRQSLAEKLTAAGWTAFVIRVDDGCYLARGLDASGTPVRALFDPATLERLGDDGHGGRGHHGGDHGNDHDEDD